MFRKQKNKLKLTRDEEFKILTIILDKVLLLGIATLAGGIFLLLLPSYDVWLGLTITLIGAMILLMFTAIIMKEVHIQRKF